MKNKKQVKINEKRPFLFYWEANIKDMKYIIGSNTLLKCHLPISTSTGQYCDKSRLNQKHHYSLELFSILRTMVSKTLRKNLVLGIDRLDSNIVPMVLIRFFFTSEFMPPIETSSPYAAGSLLFSNDIGTDPFNRTITNCKFTFTNVEIN